MRVLGLDPQAEPLAVRGRVGYLPGELRLDDNMTADEVLRFFNRLRGGRADPAYIRQLAERLDLDLGTPVKNFSKGNKQKVGLVQALMHRPELLLLDEPTSGLDPLAQQEVHRLIAAARAAGATVFFSSHVLSEVQEVAERVAILRARGRGRGGGDRRAHQPRPAPGARPLPRAARRPRCSTTCPGVKVLGRDDRGGVLLQVSGEMDGLIKALAAFPVSDFETERPSLEEVFLAYYEGDPDRRGRRDDGDHLPRHAGALPRPGPRLGAGDVPDGCPDRGPLQHLPGQPGADPATARGLGGRFHPHVRGRRRG